MMGAMPLGAMVSNTGWRLCPIDCWNQENKLDVHFEKAWNGGDPDSAHGICLLRDKMETFPLFKLAEVTFSGQLRSLVEVENFLFSFVFSLVEEEKKY